MKASLVIIFVLGVSTLGAADNSTVCCDVEGCFSNGEPWSSSSRPVPTPQCEVLDHTYVTLYTRSSLDGEIVTMRPTILPENLDPTRKMYILVTPYIANPQYLYDIKDAILSTEDANVFFFCWSNPEEVNSIYVQTVSDTRVVGALVSRLIRFLKESYNVHPSEMHCIGQGMGAHICGYGGRPLKLGRITALDAVGPLFGGFPLEVRLNSNDCNFLTAVHTDAKHLYSNTGIGIIEPIGDVDFYVNGGREQPNCEKRMKRPIVTSFCEFHGEKVQHVEEYVDCPHVRAAEVYAYALRNPDCTMWGHKIERLGREITVCKPVRHNFERCTLATCTPVGSATAKFPGRGSFYLPTTKEAPFCCPEPDTDATMYELLANSKQ